jgi:hypothetical protein
VTVEAAAEKFAADQRAAYPLGLQYLQSVQRVERWPSG